MSSDYARPGRFRVICDLSGFKCWDDETVIQWNGLRVLRRFADVRNPQDFLRAVPEGPPPTNTRPEVTGSAQTGQPIGLLLLLTQAA